jgi:hypothetical protein
VTGFRTNRSFRIYGILSSVISVLCVAVPPGIDSAASERRFRPVATVVDKVEAARLERVVRALGGSDSFVVDGEKVKIRTRYALSPQIELARRYLIDEVRSAGYEPSLQRFVLDVAAPDLTGSVISRNADTVWVADTRGTIYLTTEAGGWSKFTERGNLEQVVYGLARDWRGRLWAAGGISGSVYGYGGLFVSADGGASWNLRASGTDIFAIVTVSFDDEQFGFAAGSNGTFLRTMDSGETWDSVDPATFGNESFSDAAASAPLHYWLITDIGSLYETPDFGATWSKRSLMFGRLAGIDFHGESTGVIVGSQKAFYTKDAGATWTAVSVATEFTSVCMGDSRRVVATGTGGAIWVSDDGGATWSRFGTECSIAADVWSIASPGSGDFWLAGRDIVRFIAWKSALRGCTAYQFSDTTWGENISFRHEGERESGHCVLLTAHYDSYTGSTPLMCAPGADDNATGTAAVLECARALRDERTARSVEFVLFDCEELGLKGSRYYVSVRDPEIDYDGVLNLDMIGWEPNAAMTAVVSKRAKEPPDSIIASALVAATDSFGLDLALTVVEGERLSSDHMSFWAVGIPAVLLIEGKRDELTPNYHSCSDVAENLNYAFLEVCTKTALGAVALLAGLTTDETHPARLALHQNYPNPFNAGTTLSYALPATANVELAIHDVSGRRVALVERGSRGPGVFDRAWDGKDDRGRPLASGVYFLRLRAGADEAVRKIVILR